MNSFDAQWIVKHFYFKICENNSITLVFALINLITWVSHEFLVYNMFWGHNMLKQRNTSDIRGMGAFINDVTLRGWKVGAGLL